MLALLWPSHSTQNSVFMRHFSYVDFAEGGLSGGGVGWGLKRLHKAITEHFVQLLSEK